MPIRTPPDNVFGIILHLFYKDRNVILSEEIDGIYNNKEPYVQKIHKSFPDTKYKSCFEIANKGVILVSQR